MGKRACDWNSQQALTRNISLSRLPSKNFWGEKEVLVRKLLDHCWWPRVLLFFRIVGLIFLPHLSQITAVRKERSQIFSVLGQLHISYFSFIHILFCIMRFHSAELIRRYELCWRRWHQKDGRLDWMSCQNYLWRAPKTLNRFSSAPWNICPVKMESDQSKVLFLPRSSWHLRIKLH